jgi:NhaP-type Na+/H+ or K+/H+ antiporter
MIKSDVVPAAPMFVTTTLAVIVSTVFIQGGTIKFLVNALDIEKESEEELSISEEIHTRLWIT